MRSQWPSGRRKRAVCDAKAEMGAVDGWAAGALHSVPPTWIDGLTAKGELLPVPAVTPMGSRRRSRSGLSVTAGHLDAGDVVVVDGLPVTSALRTAFDLVRTAPDLPRAVAMGDACLRFGLATSAQLLGYAMDRPGWRGVQRVRSAAPMLDRRSESPPESELRALWIATRLGAPRPQARICDEDGWFIARVDLLDEKAAIVGEFMGRWHRRGEQPWRDTERSRRLRTAGLDVVEFWAPDLHDVGVVRALLAEAYAAAGRRPVSDRRYLVER